MAGKPSKGGTKLCAVVWVVVRAGRQEKSSCRPTIFMITIIQLKKADTRTREEVNNLLLQLSKHAKPLTLKELQTMLIQKHLMFFVAREKNHIVGMALLWFFRKVMGLQGSIEDMVVDEQYRERGIGKALCQTLIRRAKKSRLVHLDLTSRPERIAANDFYKKLGFELRDTNIYRLSLARKG